MSTGTPSIDGRRRALRLLMATLNTGVDRDYIQNNVADGFNVQAPQADEIIPWTPEEVHLFQEVASGRLKVPYRFKSTRPDSPTAKISDLIRVDPEKAVPHPLYACFYLMLAIGLRRGEALGLQWKHIDSQKPEVRILQQLVAGDGTGRGDALQRTKTRNSMRAITVPQDVLKVVQSHQAQQEKQQKVMGPIGRITMVWLSQLHLALASHLATLSAPSRN